MKLSVRALGLTSGLVWGGAMLTCGLVNLVARPYGRRFLDVMSSVYPGFHNSRTPGDVLVGAGYGFVDGAVCGAAVAAIYNQFARRETGIQAASRRMPAAALNQEVAS
jgi:hypothetical protein